MTQTPEQIAAGPKELFDAIGELALAIKPHHMDTGQHAKIKTALHVLIDHIITVGEARRAILEKNNG